MIDLSTYSAVRTALFVRIQIDEYRTTSSGSYSPVTLAMSDHNANFTIDGQVYVNVGRLMNVTATNSELRSSSNSVTISLSGIPNSAIAEIVNSKIKSAPVDIYRAFFNPSTAAQIGDTQGRFRGFVNNYSLQEDYDVNTRTASNTIILECASSIDILSRKHTGRRTNPESQKKYFANDLSMDRVPVLENTTFDFGAPK
jgi:hypothetical protein